MHAQWIGAQLTAYAPRRGSEFIKLDKLLVGQPARRKTWQEIKAALLFAMPPNPTRQ